MSPFVESEPQEHCRKHVQKLQWILKIIQDSVHGFSIPHPKPKGKKNPCGSRFLRISGSPCTGKTGIDAIQAADTGKFEGMSIHGKRGVGRTACLTARLRGICPAEFRRQSRRNVRPAHVYDPAPCPNVPASAAGKLLSSGRAAACSFLYVFPQTRVFHAQLRIYASMHCRRSAR